MSAEFHLEAQEVAELRALLRAHLPPGSRIRIFGSRATGRGLKPHSDLDLLISTPQPLPLPTRSDLREALSASNLPFTVDLVEEQEASREFIARAEAEGTVAFALG